MSASSDKLLTRRFAGAAIACFVLVPWLVVYVVIGLVRDPSAEDLVKERLLLQRPGVDTVVVGDSRVGYISEEPFARKGWTYFNFGMSGISPSDVAVQLKYALKHTGVRRVVMGLSFENMNEAKPLQHSPFAHEVPFNDPEILAYATVAPGSRGESSYAAFRTAVDEYVLPIQRAAPKLRALVAVLVKPPTQFFQPNGNVAYVGIREAIAGGTYDFQTNRDPQYYFNVHDAPYQRRQRLGEHAKAIYVRMFDTLRGLNMPCIAFETGRTAEHQRMLDADPLLVRLQNEWREFFRGQSHGSVKFVEYSNVADCYDKNDFVDSLHFIGKTGDRLAERLADELDELEKQVGKGEGRK